MKNLTFKQAVSGFYLNGIFNGNMYNVQGTVNDITKIVSTLNRSSIAVDLLTVTLFDQYDNDITPILVEEKASILSSIVNWTPSI